MTSEDIVRAPAKKPPERLTLDPDGRHLEDIIGELQSEWGVPENPQEYRLVVKVSEERPERSSSNGKEGGGNGRPRREKAPAAPRVGGDEAQAADAPAREQAPARRRSRRRRRGRGGKSSSGASG
ncbi:MAG: hypothetical protein ACRDKZ_01245 [Actinomycetota bacterium]